MPTGSTRESPQVASNPSESLIDLRNLRRLSGPSPSDGSRSFMQDVIELFFELGPQGYADVRAALAEGNGQAVAEAAHKLKSQAAYFGAGQLVEVCTELERLGSLGQLGPCTGLLDELQAGLERVLVALEAHRDGPS